MSLFTWVFYGVLIVLFLVSYIYIYKHISKKDIKNYSKILLLVAFFSLICVGYFSIRSTQKIENFQIEIEGYEQKQMWLRYVAQQNIIMEKKSIIKYQIISILILICHLEHVYLLTLNCNIRDMKENKIKY